MVIEPNPERSEYVKAALELDELRHLELELLREAALKSTWVMATKVLWPGDDAFKHFDEESHKPLCDWIDMTPLGGQRAIIMHREARKTFLFNIAHCVRLITLDPDIRIILVSALQRTAIAMCGNIKRQFMLNSHYRKVFPEMAVDDPKWGRQDDFEHPMAKPKLGQLDCTFSATYSGAPLISRRCDVLKFDDPVADEDVQNPEMARKVMRHFLQTIPLVERTSRWKNTFFIGTYKSYLDPASAITGKASSSEDVKRDLGDWEWVVRPVAYIPNGNFQDPGPFAFPDENPEARPFLPRIFPPEEIRRTFNKALIDPAQGESFFMREYGCYVMAPGDQKFLPEWFDTWIEPSHIPANTVFSGIAVDSALKDEQVLFRGDNMVILVGHFDIHGNLYLTDGARSRAWKTDDFRKVLISMVQNPKNRGVQNFLKEKVGEGTLFPIVRGWFNTAQLPFVAHPLKVIGQGKKYLRIIDSLQGPAMGRKIFFVKGQFPQDLHRILVDELAHLGQWGHDDVADALALFFNPQIGVVPAFGRSVEWKDPLSPLIQVSTRWNNPAALGQAEIVAAAGKPQVNQRLTPFGEETILSWVEVSEGSRGPATMPDEFAPWEKI